MAKEATENAYKNRQIAATEAANRLSSRNLVLTGVTAVIATVACIGTWYQGTLNRKTLEQMKADSLESSKQFQVQLSHFDAGLGRSDMLAIHAGEQANAAQKLAGTSSSQFILSREALTMVQRPFLTFTYGTFEHDLTEIVKKDSLMGVWSNEGNTPAIRAWTRVHFEPLKGINSKFNFAYEDEDVLYAFQLGVHDKKAITVFPNSSSIPVVGRSGYFYGWAVYQDPFSGTGFHLTEFGYEVGRYPVNYQLNATVIIAPEWKTLTERSCFDEDCKDYKQRVEEVRKWETTNHK